MVYVYAFCPGKGPFTVLKAHILVFIHIRISRNDALIYRVNIALTLYAFRDNNFIYKQRSEESRISYTARY